MSAVIMMTIIVIALIAAAVVLACAGRLPLPDPTDETTIMIALVVGVGVGVAGVVSLLGALIVICTLGDEPWPVGVSAWAWLSVAAVLIGAGSIRGLTS